MVHNSVWGAAASIHWRSERNHGSLKGEGLMWRKPTTCNVSKRRLFGAQLSMHRWIGAASLAVALEGGAGTAGDQNDLHDPPVIASNNGTIDILMYLNQPPIPSIPFM